MAASSRCGAAASRLLPAAGQREQLLAGMMLAEMLLAGILPAGLWHPSLMLNPNPGHEEPVKCLGSILRVPR